MTNTKSYFFCGIGGSGMLPLANIVRDGGASVAGSDRALDQGRLAPKFEWLKSLGIDIFPQDGSGLTSGKQILIASAAVEDSVPDVAKALELGCKRMTRAELLADLFNASPRSVDRALVECIRRGVSGACDTTECAACLQGGTVARGRQAASRDGASVSAVPTAPKE